MDILKNNKKCIIYFYKTKTNSINIFKSVLIIPIDAKT